MELSHLRGEIAPHTGMSGFIAQMIQRKPYDTQQILEAMQHADAAMYAVGIVAVGDISNNNSSFAVKINSNIYYHSFLEVAGLPEKVCKQRLQECLLFLKEADKLQLPASITPHAPYSMNENAFRKSVEFAKQRGILSIHNQESAEENELFLHGSGKMYDSFVRSGMTPPASIEKTSIHRLLPLINEKIQVLLVHNVFTDDEDYEAAIHICPNIAWVLCPNSNLYINNVLPPVERLLRKGATIALGTDSLASNTQLSILEEMKTLQREFPALSFEKIIEWATLGGAKALHMDKKLGSIAVGKRPGLVLIENFDFENRKLRDKSTARLLTA